MTSRSVQDNFFPCTATDIFKSKSFFFFFFKSRICNTHCEESDSINSILGDRFTMDLYCKQSTIFNSITSRPKSIFLRFYRSKRRKLVVLFLRIKRKKIPTPTTTGPHFSSSGGHVIACCLFWLHHGKSFANRSPLLTR